jgi:hypothetical protein
MSIEQTIGASERELEKRERNRQEPIIQSITI